MKFTLRSGTLLCAAALLSIPSVGLAQDNASDAANAANATTAVSGNSMADPAMSDPMAADAATNDAFNTAAPMDDTMANDMALANSVEPEREDNDFPWGLLGLIGLAGLLGRKKNDGDIHVDARRDS